MKSGKQLGQSVQVNRIPISRRLNMLGQDLTNQGFQKVKVRGRIAIEVRDDDGAKSIEHIDVDFSDYVAGKGPVSIGGDGSVEMDVPKTVGITSPTGSGKSTWDS